MISSKIKKQGSIKNSALMSHRHRRVCAHYRCCIVNRSISGSWQQVLMIIWPLMKMVQPVMRDAEA